MKRQYEITFFYFVNQNLCLVKHSLVRLWQKRWLLPIVGRNAKWYNPDNIYQHYKCIYTLSQQSHFWIYLKGFPAVSVSCCFIRNHLSTHWHRTVIYFPGPRMADGLSAGLTWEDKWWWGEEAGISAGAEWQDGLSHAHVWDRSSGGQVGQDVSHSLCELFHLGFFIAQWPQDSKVRIEAGSLETLLKSYTLLLPYSLFF